MPVYEPHRGLSIATSTCSSCGQRRPGTHLANETGEDHFVCADCDPVSFEIASDAQKEAYLGGATLLTKKVH